MRLRRLSECALITAGDDTRLLELLHPDRDYPFDGRYSLAHASVAPGQATRPHRLTIDEVYYILNGTGEMHVDSESAPVTSGDAIEIPPGATQWIINTGSGNLDFLCIVDPAWRHEDEAILD